MYSHNYLLVVVGFLGIQSAHVKADENALYPFISTEQTKQASFRTDDQTKFEFSYAPALSFGFALDYDFSKDWQLTSSLSLEYMKAKFTGSNLLNENTSGVVEQKGLWAHTRLRYMNLSNNVTPFVDVGLGVIDVDYNYSESKQHQWQKGYKTLVGFEFSEIFGATFFVGMGNLNIENKDAFNSF